MIKSFYTSEGWPWCMKDCKSRTQSDTSIVFIFKEILKSSVDILTYLTVTRDDAFLCGINILVKLLYFCGKLDLHRMITPKF